MGFLDDLYDVQNSQEYFKVLTLPLEVNRSLIHASTPNILRIVYLMYKMEPFSRIRLQPRGISMHFGPLITCSLALGSFMISHEKLLSSLIERTSKGSKNFTTWHWTNNRSDHHGQPCDDNSIQTQLVGDASEEFTRSFSPSTTHNFSQERFLELF